MSVLVNHWSKECNVIGSFNVMSYMIAYNMVCPLNTFNKMKLDEIINPTF